MKPRKNRRLVAKETKQRSTPKHGPRRSVTARRHRMSGGSTRPSADSIRPNRLPPPAGRTFWPSRRRLAMRCRKAPTELAMQLAERELLRDVLALKDAFAALHRAACHRRSSD